MGSAGSEMTQLYSRGVLSPLKDHPTSYEQRRDSVTPIDFSSRDSHLSYYFDRQYEGNGFKESRPRSQMSDQEKGSHEVPLPKAGEMYQARADTNQKPHAREQLPPLASLFGASSHPSRGIQPPYSEGSSPIFTGLSHESRPSVTTIHPDRPYDASYFQRPLVARQFSYGTTPEQVERLGIPPPPPSRSNQSGIGLESPRYNSQHGAIETSSSQASSSANGWSPRPQSHRPEYISRDTSSSFRIHPDQIPEQISNHRSETEARPSYRDAPHSALVTPSYPPTPASTTAGDPATGKDGLGPKIWTGTQFLPRFVRQAEVPGEGLCYFYDDGTHCKTVIDGEVVNAHWGVTKAGKPRKRLAIACITCREKKIKCDPDYPRCVQCEKFSRACKFKNA